MTVDAPRRLLFLNWRDSSHPKGGGSERYVEQLAALLTAGGEDVRIHCAAYRGAPRREVRDGVRIQRHGGPFSVYLFGLLAVVRQRPDVVVDVQNGMPFFSPLVHGRVVLVAHHLLGRHWLNRQQWHTPVGRLGGRLAWWVESRLVPRLYRRARYAAVSSPTCDDLVATGVAPERITVVHNATDPAPTASVPKANEPTLCVVARLVPNKRVDHAVDVLAALATDLPTLRLRIVGDGPAYGSLVQRASRLGVLDRVDLLGWLDEAAKRDAIASSWILLCPSVKEGWARVVTEAAVHAVPTIAYRDAGGVVESIRHDETGLLAVDFEDLVRHTRRLLQSASDRTAYGRAAAAYAAGFTPERMLTEFQRVLASIEAAPTRQWSGVG
jgi:glycosyltransferase involved in cell wall biosynthesis